MIWLGSSAERSSSNYSVRLRSWGWSWSSSRLSDYLLGLLGGSEHGGIAVDWPRLDWLEGSLLDWRTGSKLLLWLELLLLLKLLLLRWPSDGLLLLLLLLRLSSIGT